jgi:GNAT superfamily N-acetyltransferase
MPVGEAEFDHLVATWVEGWALARGTARPVLVSGGLRVDVGWPEQAARYVFPRLSKAVERRADSITDPWIFMKVCAPLDKVKAVLPSRWVVQPLSYFMACFEPMVGSPELPSSYTVQIADGAKLISVKILTEAGDLAANGSAALVNDCAIYDRIETDEAHRRRGLGGVVMRTLEGRASTHVARKGLLVATEAGRALYERLGWSVVSPYVSAVIPGVANTASW